MSMKRLIDLVVSIVALGAASPLMLVAAILIKLDSPGPIIFRQEGVGKDQRRFKVIKFRTMRHRHGIVDQAAEAVLEGSTDARVTRVGRLLRTSSIDEIPQLINVLKGEMSIVGPRPL